MLGEGRSRSDLALRQRIAQRLVSRSLQSGFVQFTQVLQYVTTASRFDGYERRSSFRFEKHGQIVQASLLGCVRPSFGGPLVYESFFDCQRTISHPFREIVGSIVDGLCRNRK
jgi:hypothetical protein